MAKKVNKRAAHNTQKEKRFPTSSLQAVLQEIVLAKEAHICPHLDKGTNLEKFSKRILSPESLISVTCDYCLHDMANRKITKRKDKSGKNKGNLSKSESNLLWVCLECGHFSCSDAGFLITPQSHTTRHAKEYRHPLFLKFSYPDLRYCFSCNTSIPVQWSDKNGELEDVLSEFVKLVKPLLLPKTRVVEAILHRTSSITPHVDLVNTLQNCLEGRNGGYMVKGLVNLGNTCFLNSVLQNLLAVHKLREYLLKLEGLVGPITASLKKLFVEMSSSTGTCNVINPRSFFGCFCTKASQFKGFQQHDSHELLRCLLDELCSEESRVQTHSQDGSGNANHASTFVDTLFGGQVSSTVSCLECGHSSVVYEPYLDLSLPLPTKRSSSKKTPPVAGSKKSVFFSNRKGKIFAKPEKASDSLVGNGVTSVLNSDDSSGATQSMETSGGKNAVFLCDSTHSGSVLLDAIGDKNDSSLQDEIHQMDSTVALVESLVQRYYGEPVSLFNGYDKYTASSSNAFSLECSMPTMPYNGHDTTCEQLDSFDSKEASWMDYRRLGKSVIEDTTSPKQDLLLIQDSENSDDDLSDDEPLAIAHESLLPCKETVSTCVQEPSDFNGSGYLFCERKPVFGPTMNPLFNRIKGSESDPDEVDDTDSPVSVEKCLAYFTTPELLTQKEHAWECGQCSKTLLEQKTILKNKLKKFNLNGYNNEISIASSVLGTDYLHFNGFENHNNQSTAGVDDSDENLAFCNGMSDSYQDTESCNINGFTDISETENSEQKESELQVSQHESDSSDDDEVGSKGVKVVRDASKRILISKAPPVLTIHLKRFCQDACGRLRKLNGHVNFSDTFDLKPYMDPSCCRDKEYKYQLVGVVVHSGTMRGGHYVAYVRGAKGSTGTKDDDNGLWYYASDANVREVSLDEVLRCDAYILFYEEM
uniref:ubiquitin carboxyl-terminal hydrolase 2-like n=1 Tax=Erigeron canadensis TaxID=72917 RepID=UPI001CB8EA48|nr:ubiquitin carboxyl-terminal hydrolase 2-like [Erigeron canadensis]